MTIKFGIFAFLTLALILAGCTTQTSKQTPTGFATLEGAGSGLIAWYKFDEGTGSTAADSSGNGNDATVNNGASWASGRINGALNFDGNDDLVRASSDFLGTNDATVAAWIRPSGFGEGGSNGTILTNGQFIFRLRSPAAQLDYRARGNTMSGSAIGSITLDTWQFVAITRSGTTANLYVNGVLSGSANQTNEAPLAGSYGIIIGNNSQAGLTFQGEIDEVRVYNRVLPQTEIAELYSYNGTSSPTANQLPVANISASPQSGTAPLAVTFNGAGSTDSDGTITTYSWNFGDGTSASGASTSHTYNAAGTYTTTLTVTDNAGATASATTTITATGSQAQTYTLTVSKSGTGAGTITTTGINCGSDCQESLDAGTTVMLSAAASSGSSFSGWSGACSGAQTTCTISITGNATVTATFDSVSTASPECSAANIRCVPSEYTTIQACANVAVAGDTCLVADGNYNERVTVQSSGTSNSNRVTFLAQAGARPRMHGFYLPTRSYVTIEGFEITSIGMTPISDRIININGGTGINVLNNYIHDTSYAQCILSSATSAVFRGNDISFCGVTMSIFGTAAGARTIDSSNNQVKFSVQGGPSQTITIPSGAYTTQNNWFSLVPTLNALMSGAVAVVGASGRFEIRSTTSNPSSTITLEPVSNNAYTAFGWTEGIGQMHGIHSAITISGNDSIFENNTVSNVGDYVTIGGTDVANVIVRNNTFGPAHPYSAQHIDGVQTNNTNGTQKLLFENNKSVSNNNVDNHLALFQRPSDRDLILRFNTTFESPGAVDCTRGTYYGFENTSPGLYFYHNTFYNNAVNGGQLYCRTATNNFSRNNIWYNSTVPNRSPYGYDGAGYIGEKDYDLWYLGGNPAEVNAINADPRFVSGTTGDFRLQSNSPAIDRGGPLTGATNQGAGSNSLTVGSANFFQDGWAGVNPDWIAIGSSTNVAQISSINYTTNTITLASPLSWSLGDPVYLYKDSDGTQVLFGQAPDIGAYEYGSATSQPTPVNGICGAALNTCIPGTLNNIADSNTHYLWNCNGTNGGTNASCSLARINSAPAVTLTSPANNSVHISPANIALAAQATDSDGTIARVEFYNTATLLATDTAAPYSYIWNNVADGNYTLSARAYDDQNANTTSTQTRITITRASGIDSDGDGIDDTLDRCPRTSTQARAFVNQYGCAIPISTKFDIKPDFNATDINGMNNLEIGILGIGKITYTNQSIVLVKTTNAQDDRLSLDTDVNIAMGKITINTTNLPQLNKSATITLYGITAQNPTIKKDGQTCTQCTIISYDRANGTLVFTVPGF